MKREQKYPDTDTFVYFNANTRNRLGGDCVVRAVATATGQDWELTVRELTEAGIKKGYVLNDKHTYTAYLKSKGFTKHPQPRKPDGTKYTGAEFCKQLAGDRTIVAHIGGHHVVAIIGGRVHDIWDSTGKCVGNYWSKN